MRTGACSVALATASIALVAVGNAGGGDTASRTVDRNLACTVRGIGEPDAVRYLDVHGSPRAGDDAPAARAATVTGGAAAPGAPPPADSVGVGFHTRAFAGRTNGLVWVNQSTCTLTRAHIGFTTKGLRGGQVARFGESHRCDVPSRLLIRVRAVFGQPVTLRPDRQASYFLSAGGRIMSAALAVTTATGQPIAYASVDDMTGKARIFTSPSSCFPT